MRIPYPHQNEALSEIALAIKLIINLPTGTGKSLIQAWAIAEDIKSHQGNVRVHCVLAPRILLANQLYLDIKTDLVNIGIDAQYAIVNSGNASDKSDMKWFESIRKIEMANGIEYRDLHICKRIDDLNNLYASCIKENVPLVIIGNYQSSDKINKANFIVNSLHCDEAHYLVPNKEEDNDFSWIATDFDAERKYFYTATMRFTKGIFGMNNSERYGELFQKLPAELIQAGRIIRPRIHLVDVALQPKMEEEDRDAIAVVDAFREHQAMISYNSIQHLAAKMLVVAKGSKHLNDLVNHPTIQQLMSNRPNLKIFDITSKFEARINGEIKSRETFLKELKALGDHDEAIIFHVRILCEGIDVPGITGIMPLNNLKKSAFLQTLGRATRLHLFDRRRIDEGSLEANDLHKFVKPYAWIIIPVHDDLGEEMKADFTEMVKELRTFGFNASEDIFIKDSKGGVIAKPIDMTTSVNTKTKSYTNFFTYEVNHIIEKEEIAGKLEEERQIKNEELQKLRDVIFYEDTSYTELAALS